MADYHLDGLDGTCIVNESILEDKRPLYDQLQELRTVNPKLTVNQLAGRIRVNQRVVELPYAHVRTLITRFAQLDITPPLDAIPYLDRTWYELWFEGNSARFYAFIQGPPMDSLSADDHPLVRWMVLVNQTVRQTPNTGKKG